MSKTESTADSDGALDTVVQQFEDQTGTLYMTDCNASRDAWIMCETPVELEAKR